MPATTFSLHRHTPHFPPHLRPLTTSLRRNLSVIAATRHRDPDDRPPQPSKHALRARETVKKHSSSLSSLTPLSPHHVVTITLSPTQAVGMVTASHGNLMRVVLTDEPSRTLENVLEGSEVLEGSGTELEERSRTFENVLEGSGTGTELLCVVRAVLKKIGRVVMVGDRVLVGSVDWEGQRGMIEDVFPRKSVVPDPPVANADHFLVVFAMDRPTIEPIVLTRFLVEAESIGVPFTLAFNKCDLVDDEVRVAWDSRLRQWGYSPIFCCAESKLGLDSLASTLRKRTTVVVGPSGVGKSSLINVLRSPDHLPDGYEKGGLSDPVSSSKWFKEQRVMEVSTRSGRGKHTTRNVSLLPLAGGGYLADTPGFSQPSLLKVTKHSLAQAFPEIQKMLEENEPKNCAFNDCLHIGEPGCLVSGDWERFPYYIQLLDEIKVREEVQLRTMGTKREGDVRKKVGNMGAMQAEPRLERKKHRRQSRKKLNQSVMDNLDELDEDDES